MVATRRKVLMLHGHSQNAQMFRSRFQPIAKACAAAGADIEFVFLDAPHILWPTDLPPARSSVGEARVNEVSYEQDTTAAPRAWWHITEMRTKCPGIEEGIRTVRDVLAKDKFEGVFGFSQGASIATTISAILERPYLHPEFTTNGKPIHPPFRFCVAVSGFVPPCALGDTIFGTSYSTPTLHILGRNDVVIREEDTIPLLNKSVAKHVEYHPGGHFVPNRRRWPKFFADFILDTPAFATSPSPSSPAPSSVFEDTDALSPASTLTELELELPPEADVDFDKPPVAIEELRVGPAQTAKPFGELKFPSAAALAKLRRPMPRLNTDVHQQQHRYPYYQLLTPIRPSAASVVELQRQVSELQIFTSYYWHFIFIASLFLSHEWRILFVLSSLFWVFGRRYLSVGSVSSSVPSVPSSVVPTNAPGPRRV